MSEPVSLSLLTFQEFVEFRRIASRAVRRAQERNRKLGIPNAFSRNGRIYYELPSGELTEEDPFVEGRTEARPAG